MISVFAAAPADAGELLTAQLAAYVQEAQAVDRTDIPPSTRIAAVWSAVFASPPRTAAVTWVGWQWCLTADAKG